MSEERVRLAIDVTMLLVAIASLIVQIIMLAR